MCIKKYDMFIFSMLKNDLIDWYDFMFVYLMFVEFGDRGLCLLNLWLLLNYVLD